MMKINRILSAVLTALLLFILAAGAALPLAAHSAALDNAQDDMAGKEIAPYPNIFNQTVEDDKLFQFNLIDYILLKINEKRTIIPVYKESDPNIDLFTIHDIISNKQIGFVLNGFMNSNKNYFSNDEKVEFISIFHNFNLYDYMNNDLYPFNKIHIQNLSIDDAVRNGEKLITIDELTKIYKQLVLEEYWPVLVNKNINENKTLPNIKEEILNKPLDKNIGVMLANSSNKKNTDLVSIVLVYEDNKTGTLYDFITGERATNPNKLVTIDNEYARKTKIKQNSTIMYENFFSEDSNVQFFLPEYYQDFANCKTYGDAIDFIQKQPIEAQIDYSYFDFKDSPVVDPSWLANQPTPPPYAELTLGSRGQEVLNMKQRFLELDYFRTTSFSDRFTDSTADTVRLFEKNNGLPVDGVADAGMLDVLFSDRAKGK